MRVLLTLPGIAGGGVARIALALAGGLARRGHAVTLLLYEETEPSPYAIPPGVRVVVLSRTAFRRRRLPVLALSTFRHARDADVVVAAEEGRAGALAIASGVLLRKPVIGWVHVDWRLFAGRTSWRTRLGVALNRIAARVVAVSAGAAQGLVARVGIPADRVPVIHNAAPVDAIAARAADPLPSGIGHVFDEPTIVAVGRLDEEKGLDVLVRALARLRDEGRAVRLVLVGRGGLEGALRALAEELGVADAVIFAGQQTNPFPFMRRASVVVSSSRFEGFGLVLLEALAAGAAVVATDCPSGPRDILEDGRYGVLVPVDDPAALAAAIGSVLDDHDFRDALRAAGPGRARAFDEEGFVDRWESLLETVSREAERGRPTGEPSSTERRGRVGT